MAEQRSVPDYENPDTGSDPSKWDQKTVADCPQRGRQPKLDLSPEDSDYFKGDWKDPIGAKYCQEDYGDVGHNQLNEPVKQRKGAEPNDGWVTERGVGSKYQQSTQSDNKG